MKNIKIYLIAIILAAITSYLMMQNMAPQGAASQKSPQPVYERVMKTGKFRCGYNFYEPAFSKNEQTGEFYGLYYALVEELGRLADIEIEWTALVDWGGITAALNTNKVDAFCLSVWPSAQRAKAGLLFSDPMYYEKVQAYARADDARFDNGLAAINDPTVTLILLDEKINRSIAEINFPQAKRYFLPELSSDGDLLSNLKYKKGDVAFTNQSVFIGFNKKNPGVLRQIAPENPLRTFGTTIVMRADEVKLKHFLDTSIEEMINSGHADRILAKYEKDYPNVFFPVATPYEKE